MPAATAPRVRLRADELREKIHREMGIPKLPPPSHLGLLISTSSPALPRPSLPTNTTVMRTGARPHTAWSASNRSPTSLHSPDGYASPFDFGNKSDHHDPDAVVMSASALPPRRQSLSAPKLMKSMALSSPVVASGFVHELPGDSPTLERSLSKPLPPLTHRDETVPSKSRSNSVHTPGDLKSSRTRSFAVSKLNPKRISRSLPRSTKLARLSEEMHVPDIFDDSNWEADVDFCYQHSAESTCDFDWSFVDLSVPRPEGGRSLCESLDSANVPGQTLSSKTSNVSTGASVNVSDARTPSPVSERFGADHQRGPSVGHRGFLAARNGGTAPTTPVLDLSMLDRDYGCESPALGRGLMSFPHAIPQSNGSKWSPRVDSANAEYPSDEECILTGVHLSGLSLSSKNLSRVVADDSAVRSSTRPPGTCPTEPPQRRRSKSAASSSTRPLVAPWPSAQLPFAPSLLVTMPSSDTAAARPSLPRRPSTPQRFSRLLDSPIHV
ncbi:uncharacterized protein K489DRAFT_380346 [Dissoconium aciculare CBS 342.82]|uniref:Uncharacterized protein n=1 Tax=Dissoconium aciculare CBS 342.82 TaxID=1314786 RepID=A0A6J3M7X9_9PEZI|nr:uncharacterized protein K489DRAFT_380346 [Dissoconium aciculare CBS 342.82]KAF1822957.1 hypothetical protein K489DRAFT_380346 [Dissoconium aciculare CBS 342.82]